MPSRAMAYDDDIEEYVEEPDKPARGRYRLVIIILGVGCVALAVSNIVLATRVTALRQAADPERSAVARAPIEEPGRAADRQAAEPPPAASIPSPAPGPSPVSTAPDVPPTRGPGPAAAVDPAREGSPPQLELPPRPEPRTTARVAPTAPTSERVAPTPSSRERATASWMVREYGRLDAETRARTVAEFYDARSPERAYWRRVLSEIVAERR